MHLVASYAVTVTVIITCSLHITLYQVFVLKAVSMATVLDQTTVSATLAGLVSDAVKVSDNV